MAGVGHGKLLLFGEHAAVYGHPAFGTQLDMRFELALEAGDSWSIDGVDIRHADAVISFLEYGRQVLPALRPGRVHIRSSVPLERGFGSSAAACVALVREVEPHLPDSEVWKRAHALEAYFHGTPSGIDTGLACHPGLHVLYPSPPGVPGLEPVVPGGSYHLVVGSVPRERSTGELVAAIRTAVSSGDNEMASRMERLGRLSLDAADIVRGPEDPVSLGKVMDEAQNLLRQSEVSTERLESVLGELKTLGALGGKLSGGGGGGSFFALFSEPALTRTAVDSLSRTYPELVGSLFPISIGLEGQIGT